LLWFFWFWLPIRRSAVVTAVSKFTKSELVRHVGCDPAKVYVVPDPVPAGCVWSEKMTASDPPNVLQVGTGWNKNLERVAEALKGIPCTLEIIGPLAPDQLQTLESNGIAYRTHIHVTDGRLLELYKSSDIVVFASLYEGFGLPIVEAQAIGRPVVTSNGCSMPEVAGGAACPVDPLTVASVRQGIQLVIENEKYRDDLVERGFANVKRFAPEVIGSHYGSLYWSTPRRARTRLTRPKPNRASLPSGTNSQRA
jgi:glycosyltransferase involved in cell wall biosynthesis